MSRLTLVIGSKRYSSWSLRPWLALRQAGLAFDEILIPLRQPDTAQRVLAESPSGKVPLLRHGAVLVWESLAICEYTAELAPAAGLWPAEPEARALARAVSAEMHAGFAALRQALPMDVCATVPLAAMPEAAAADIGRIIRLWQDCRARFGAGGPFLFGRFSIADAMFAPVVTRFTTYAVELDAASRAYVETISALPAMGEWKAAAQAEAG